MLARSKLALGAALLACSVSASGCGLLIATLIVAGEGGGEGAELLIVPLGFMIDIGAGITVAEERGPAAGILVSAAMIACDIAILAEVSGGEARSRPADAPTRWALAYRF